MFDAPAFQRGSRGQVLLHDDSFPIIGMNHIMALSTDRHVLYPSFLFESLTLVDPART